MLACGASAPDCSTSSIVSPEPLALLTRPDPPSMLSSLMRLALVLILRTLDQKWVASDGWRLAYVMMPSVWPWPRAPARCSGVRPYCVAKFAGVRLPFCRLAGVERFSGVGVCTALLLPMG